MNNYFYVLTGGPGTGKTSVLNALQKRGYEVVQEEARQIIKEQMALNENGLPWKDKKLYTALMLNASVDRYNKILTENNTSACFFDRGIIDTLCHAEMIGLGVSEKMSEIVRDFPYNKKVFLFPYWQEIYQTDEERKQTREEAILTSEIMKETYLKYGYEVIEVPKEPIEKRVDFVLNHLKNNQSILYK